MTWMCHQHLRIGWGRLVFGGVVVSVWILVVLSSSHVIAGVPAVQNQMSPMRQDSIKVSTAPDVPKPELAGGAVPHQPPLGSALQPPSEASALPEGRAGVEGYDPAGRRDPFAPIVLEALLPEKADENLPPLQRVALTELNLIAVVWGAHGYTAMVQTPEGLGYTVRRGTRIGQKNGIVSAVTERGIIVQERFTDVYGKKQELEYVKLLHPKEGVE